MNIKPYKKGYFDVGDGHKLYYECCGNKKSVPILFLHGGPGAGFNDGNKEYFDLRKCNLILFDQRGAGRSKPFASIENNNTDKLVQDINKLMDFLEIKKFMIFGGSWGSTLALIYAIRNPKKVKAMILRGIYTATKDENRFYTEDVKYVFPEEYEQMASLVPKDKRKNILKYYAEKMRYGNKKTRKKYAFEWTLYEMSIISLFSKKNRENKIKKFPYLSLGVLETYYLSNNCFIPEGYILKNSKKLKMPISIVQGRYDMVCPPITAYRLHKKLPRSRLNFTISGHSGSDPETKNALREEVKAFVKKYG